MRNVPSKADSRETSNGVSSDRTFTVAEDTGNPWGSTTVPVIVAEGTCAASMEANNRVKQSTRVIVKPSFPAVGADPDIREPAQGPYTASGKPPPERLSPGY